MKTYFALSEEGNQVMISMSGGYADHIRWAVERQEQTDDDGTPLYTLSFNGGDGGDGMIVGLSRAYLADLLDTIRQELCREVLPRDCPGAAVK